jgi:hypothetical protein
MDQEISERWTDQVRIDKDNLDEELIHQPALYQSVGEAMAEAVSNRDFADAELNRLCAETSLYIRQHPGEFPFKLTEDSIASAVLTNPQVVEARTAYLNAKKHAQLMTNTLSVFERRHGVLENLVRLYLSGYFMDASASNLDARTEHLRELHQQFRDKKRQGAT